MGNPSAAPDKDKTLEVLAIIKSYKLESVNGSIQLHFSAGQLCKIHKTQVI